MLDKEKLRERLRSIFVDELDRQVASLRESMTALRDGVDQSDLAARLEVARRAAHSLKGAARSAGVPEVQQSALQVERVFAEVYEGRRGLDSLDFPLLFAAAEAFEAAGQDLRAQRSVAGTRVEKMFPELEALAEGRAGAAQATSAKTSPAGPVAAKILVVDDSETNLNFMKIILESQGFSIVTAADGEAAVDVLRAESVALVLADINMPRMNGIRLVEAIRASDAWRALPVVLLSGLEDPEERRRGEQAGANAYLSKGTTDNQSLLAVIRSLLPA